MADLDDILQQALDEFEEDGGGLPVAVTEHSIEAASDRAAAAAASASPRRPCTPSAQATSSTPGADGDSAAAVALEKLMQEMGSPDFQRDLAAALGSGAGGGTSATSTQTGDASDEHLLQTLAMLQRLAADAAGASASGPGSAPAGVSSSKDGHTTEEAPPSLTEADLERMASELASLGGGGGSGGIATGLESSIDGMMQKLLSKDIMHEPLQQICTRFPSWLAENAGRLSAAQLDQYRKQHTAFQRVVELYDTEPGNFPRLMELLGELQEFGQPPADILRELAPEFDFGSGNPGGAGGGLFAALGAGGPGLGGLDAAAPECAVM